MVSKKKPQGFQDRMDDLLQDRNEFMRIFKKGAEFTEELLKENERLRYRCAQLGSRARVGDGDESLVKELVEKIQRLEDEREEFIRRAKEVEAENSDFASRYLDIENENNNLMNIYVASYQLHSTLDFQEVIQIITEIILNFVGAEVFGIALLDERTSAFHPLVCEGIAEEDLAQLPIDSGVIGEVLRDGKPKFTSEIEGLHVDIASPAICIPLSIKERIIGVIMVYRFLPQKTQLAHVDHELFTLLAGHAATAIFSAKLYTDSRRKLNTIQGLIDLVTS